MGEPEDIASGDLLLASDEASWITGMVLNIDRGPMAGIPRFGSDLHGDPT